MNELTTRPNNTDLMDVRTLADLGQVANNVAAQNVFQDYRSRKADHTTRRQDADLALFAHYLLYTMGVVPADLDELPEADRERVEKEIIKPKADALAAEPATWAGTTWGLVSGFVQWSLQKGYAVGSCNVRLSTIKTYATLAAKAGTVEPEALVLIKAVSGYKSKEALRIDKQREAADVPTRIGRKKRPILIGRDEAEALKNDHEDSPQGRRDRLLISILIDHGLRVSEVSGLNVGDFDLTSRQFRFYRPKVDKIQTHDLTTDSYNAANAYFENDAPPVGPLFRGSRKGGRLTGSGWSIQKMNERVKVLGKRLANVDNLSPHDLRHYWATTAARNGTPIDRLQEAGGWSNPTTPLTRYIEPAKIANEGVKLN